MAGSSSLSQLLDQLAPDLPAEPGWDDVLARAERLAARANNGRPYAPSRRLGPSRRRRGYLVAALALLALVFAVVAAAYALGHPIVRFGTAPRASSRTVVNFFGRYTIGGPTTPPAGIPIGPPTSIPVLPHQARRITDVRIEGRDYVLWIAPIRHGGFCYAWSTNSVNGCDPGSFEVSGVGQRRGDHELLTVVGGSFRQANTARIRLSYADSRTSEIPFVWVTAPIRAGFYLYGIPPAQQRLGHETVRIALLDRSGKPISSQPLPGLLPAPPRFPRLLRHQLAGYPPLMVPAAAEWAKRRQLFSWRADTGTRVGLWIAPGRGGGSCYWSNQGSGCSATTPGWQKVWRPFWPRIRPGRGYVSLCCTMNPGIARFELFFQDGDHVTLTPKHGYLIWPIPSRHNPPHHRLDKLVAYNKHGVEIEALTIPTDIRALYPCIKPKDYGYGLSMCP